MRPHSAIDLNLLASGPPASVKFISIKTWRGGGGGGGGTSNVEVIGMLVRNFFGKP